MPLNFQFFVRNVDKRSISFLTNTFAEYSTKVFVSSDDDYWSNGIRSALDYFFVLFIIFNDIAGTQTVHAVCAACVFLAIQITARVREIYISSLPPLSYARIWPRVCPLYMHGETRKRFETDLRNKYIYGIYRRIRVVSRTYSFFFTNTHVLPCYCCCILAWI